MKLSPRAFNAHIRHMGQQVEWRRSFACPCVNAHSGAAKPGCPVCGGKGRAWAAPVACVVGVSGQRTQLAWAKFGQYESGDMVVILPSDSPAYAMGQFDRLRMLNSTDRFSRTLVHGTERMQFIPKSVSRVFWLNQANAIVDGGIPTVGTNGALTWTTGEPPAGATYTIEGERYSEYFCFGEYPSDRGIHSGAALPRKAVLRNFDLFGR